MHARCDNQGLPIGFILTGGEASDYTVADDLSALSLPKPKALLADKGYDGDRFREDLLLRGILPIIPPRSNRKAPVHPDYRRYKDRNRVERMFGKLKQQRRIATRYDITVLSFESFLNLAAARLWLKSFVNTAWLSAKNRGCALGPGQRGVAVSGMVSRGQHLYGWVGRLEWPPARWGKTRVKQNYCRRQYGSGESPANSSSLRAVPVNRAAMLSAMQPAR